VEWVKEAHLAADGRCGGKPGMTVGDMSKAAGAFLGNRFVGATWRPGVDAGALGRLRAAIAGWTVVEGDGWLVASELAPACAQTARLALVLGRERMFDRTNANFPGAEVLIKTMGRSGRGALDGMAPPFRAVWADKASGAVHGEADLFGVGHVFSAQADGFSALASSATLLGDILAAPTSPQTLAGYALFGVFLAQETPFAGVTKLAPGETVVLEAGRLSTSAKALPATSGAGCREAFQASVLAMLKAAPEAELELSGGLDSRLILAAMPPADRRGRRAITIGVAADPSGDVTVARALAETEGLDWSILDVGGMAALDGPSLGYLLSRAVAAYDHMANPVDKIALITAGAGRKVDARFGGQNGEILRGFYYPTQPLDAAPSEALARRLIAVRLEANDRVDDAVLAPQVRQDLRAAAEDRMTAQLLSYGGDWGQTLDRYYLAQRMQNWVGVSAGNRFVGHAPLYPFFDPDFVAAAMAAPAGDKLNSRGAYRLLAQIDPQLARRPLDNGIVPATAGAASPLAGHLADLRMDVDRVAKRVRRRLAGVGRATLGSQTVAQQWHGLALHKALPMDRLARSGLFDPAALDRLAAGTWLPDRPTLGFLLLVAGLETRS
jgi:asparagine synthase (glutamine-hydrolysing)